MQLPTGGWFPPAGPCVSLNILSIHKLNYTKAAAPHEKPATWPSRYGVMVFAERRRSYITKIILLAFAKTHATATHRQLAHTAKR